MRRRGKLNDGLWTIWAGWVLFSNKSFSEGIGWRAEALKVTVGGCVMLSGAGFSECARIAHPKTNAPTETIDIHKCIRVLVNLRMKYFFLALLASNPAGDLVIIPLALK